MQLIISTTNIIHSSLPILNPRIRKSNAELTEALKLIASTQTTPPYNTASQLHLPAPRVTPLEESRDSYNITVKLFHLSGARPVDRPQHVGEALKSVLAQLRVDSVDLLIVAFPEITFDADADEDDGDEDDDDDNGAKLEPYIVDTWHRMQTLHTEGLVRRLGLAEFGTHRLRAILEDGGDGDDRSNRTSNSSIDSSTSRTSNSKAKPSVDHIRLNDCCVVPQPLIRFAKLHRIELLTHNDCAAADDMLSASALQELLTPSILESSSGTNGNDNKWTKAEPLWVIKYTAVVINRGVVENKSYIVAAQLS